MTKYTVIKLKNIFNEMIAQIVVDDIKLSQL